MAHKDVEYFVGVPGYDWADNRASVFKTFEKAAAAALNRSMGSDQKVVIDVVVWSRAGAKREFGDWGAEQYDTDPEASVFLRIEVRGRNLGQIR